MATPVDLPAVAGLYSQLAGVLAGFGFAGILALMATQLTTTTTAPRTLESGRPLVGAFIALTLSSLNYAVVAGEVADSARVAGLQSLSGVGLGAAGLMLIYALLILVQGIRADVPAGASASEAMANLLRYLLVYAIPVLVLLLLWNGVRDHLGNRYGPDAALMAADWSSIATLAVVVIVAIVLQVRYFNRPEYHPNLTTAISYFSCALAIVSLLSTSLITTFTKTTDFISDAIPGVAVPIFGAFTLLVQYSSARYKA